MADSLSLIAATYDDSDVEDEEISIVQDSIAVDNDASDDRKNASVEKEKEPTAVIEEAPENCINVDCQKENISTIKEQMEIEHETSPNKDCGMPTSGKVNNSLTTEHTVDEISAKQDCKNVASQEKNPSVAKDQIILDTPMKNVYRTKESETESDSEEDSSSSSESSTDDSSTSDSSESDSSSDSEEKELDGSEKSESLPNRREKTHQEKGEYDDLPPIEDLQISMPEVLCDPMGEVGWIVEQMVIVTPKPKKPTLNLDTVLFVEKGQRVLGRIFDVFGPVSEPHYCIRFNDPDHIKNSNITAGMTVYYCPNTPYTTVVFMKDLLEMKATDDVGEDEHPEFSDDEEEKAYYAALRQKQGANKPPGTVKNTQVPPKRSRPANKTGWKSKHPWSSERKSQQHYNRTHETSNPSWSHNQYQMQQQNTWSYPSNNCNPWMLNPAYQNWQQPLYNSEQSQFRWPTSSSFPRTQQDASWITQPPPPPPPPDI